MDTGFCKGEGGGGEYIYIFFKTDMQERKCGVSPFLGANSLKIALTPLKKNRKEKEYHIFHVPLLGLKLERGPQEHN